MKLLYAILIGFFTISIASAKQLSPSESLERLPKNLVIPTRGTSGIDTTPLITVSPRQNIQFKGVYVFPYNDAGYLIVSADDIACPLLGYTDNNAGIDLVNNPEFNYWLNYYADQIYEASQTSEDTFHDSVVKKLSLPDWNAIEPLITTKWGQESPFNDDCPQINNRNCLAGCVAVTMAQIMNYYKFPAKGEGSHSYEWDGKNLSMNFDEINFDWKLMLDSYDTSSPQESKEAVASLLYACGVSVEMDYGLSFSGSYSSLMMQALYNYFGYDKSMAYIPHSNYNEREWAELIYNQLASGCPVAFSATSYTVAHSFICDGYDGEGFFHFNWGQSGFADGYFLLSALDPFGNDSQSISNTTTSFHYDQQIIINIKPASNDSEIYPAFYPLGNTLLYLKEGNKIMLLESGDSFPTGAELYVSNESGFVNYSCATLDYKTGIELAPEKGEPIIIESALPEVYDELESLYKVSGFNVEFPKNISDGIYDVSPVFLIEGREWEKFKEPCSPIYQTLKFNIKDGEVTVFESSDMTLDVIDIAFQNQVFIDEIFVCDLKLKNIGDYPVYTEFAVALTDENGNIAGVSAIPGILSLDSQEEKKFQYMSIFEEYDAFTRKKLQPGEYYYRLISANTGTFLTDFSSDAKIIVNENNQNTSFDASLIIQGGATELNTSQITFDVTITCTEGYFSDLVYVIVRPVENGSDEKLPPVGYNVGGPLMVGKGESRTIPITVDVQPSDYRTFQAYVGYNFGDNVINQCSEPVYFVNNYSGIETVIDSNDDVAIKIVNGLIDISSSKTISKILLCSSAGNVIKEYDSCCGFEYTLDTTGMQPGLYIAIIVTSDSKKHIFKIFK